MKIGVSTLALYPWPLEDILSYLEDLKVDYFEIIHEYPHHEVNPDLINSHSIKTSVHSPLSDINLASPNKSIRKTSISQVKKSMDLAVDLNSEIVVVHPGQVPFLSRRFKDKILSNSFTSLDECQSYAEDIGISMCVENMPHMEGFLFQDINELNQLVKDLGALITLDVGHAHTMGFSTNEMISSDHLGHLHLSDNDGSFDNHEALGECNIDFENLLKTLNKKNYRGILTIEVKNEIELLKSLDYLREILKKI
jgi:sugar phosphate isomerase/epimerase